MSAPLSSGNTNVAYNTTDAATAHEYTSAFTPDLVQFIEKCFVIFNVTHLPFTILLILFESPVWGRRDNKVNCPVF